jgi:hypothetical protein
MAEHEFKKDDRVVFVKDDYCGGVEMPKGTLATYDDDDYHALPWVRLDTGERVITWHDRIAHAEHDTPAPLDPAKVKAGDTVTVRVGPSPDTGWGALRHGPEAIEVTGKVWLDSGDNPHGPVAKVGVHTLDLPNVTLTAHQPAPEPEPEWTDGTVAEVTYNNADETEQFKTRALRGDGSWVPFADVSDLIMDDEVTDVRPLVVIDPAAARKSLEDNGWGAHETADILEHLGLNR